MANTTGLLIKLNKLVASKVPCSRMEAKAYIAKGLVRIDGQVIDQPGQQVPATADVRLDTQRIAPKVTIALHKPLGYVSTQPEHGNRPAIQLLTKANEFRANSTTGRPKAKGAIPREPYTLKKLAVAGRLDVHSTGLLLFTQCGATAASIIGEDTHLEKEYLVRLWGHDTLDPKLPEVQAKLKQLRKGIHDDGQFMQAKSVKLQNEDQLLIVLTTGKNHQIRRMVKAVGWSVKAIKRVRIGNLSLGNLPLREWRYVDSPLESITGKGEKRMPAEHLKEQRQ